MEEHEEFNIRLRANLASNRVAELSLFISSFKLGGPDFIPHGISLSIYLSLTDRVPQRERALKELESSHAQAMGLVSELQLQCLSLDELRELREAQMRGLRLTQAAIEAKLTAERNDEKDRHTCVICEDRAISTVLMPCRHMVMCSECASQVRTCPIDRVVIEQRVDTFGR